eukprot:GEMP01054967.1.p1 GENE.GEMP01054967.1~~GEMP01054967.1.p1  ORF type:complete len:116 (+),score=3.31 GEMP01054967.1:203-550(+)
MSLKNIPCTRPTSGYNREFSLCNVEKIQAVPIFPHPRPLSLVSRVLFVCVLPFFLHRNVICVSGTNHFCLVLVFCFVWVLLECTDKEPGGVSALAPTKREKGECHSNLHRIKPAM